ncbi:MAG TPA: tetratricopeptide repeat protein [Vicinamibacterales bacterium]|nr:tetratricopeptide repeat protein [Vicinamibacterales bacterium]
MRPNGKAALLLVVALAAVGCSKRDKPQAKAATPDSASVKPITEPGVPATLKQIDDEEGLPVDTKPKAAGPVSYADGEAAYKARKYTDATTIFEQYTTQKPNNAWGYYMFGMSAWKAGDLPKAEMGFKAALGVDPEHLKSLANLSRVLIEQKRFDDALNTLMRAGDIEPTSNEVQRLIGRAYNALGKTDDAIEAYRHAIELNEKDVWSMNNLGLVFLEQKRAEEAMPLLLKAVDLRKDVAAFHNNLGMAFEHTRRFKDAAGAYNDALSADPGYEKAKQNLARVEAVKLTGEEDDERAGSK